MSYEPNKEAGPGDLEDPAETLKSYDPKRMFDLFQRAQAANPPAPMTVERAYNCLLERMAQNEFMRSYRTGCGILNCHALGERLKLLAWLTGATLSFFRENPANLDHYLNKLVADVHDFTQNAQ